MMRTANPTLKADTFTRPYDMPAEQASMTLQGAVNKTAILLALLVLSAGFTWIRLASADPAAVMPVMWGGLIGGLIVGVATSFKPTWSPISAPLYAIVEGLFIGAISMLFERSLPGIVVQASLLTFGILAAMLAIYTTGIIKPTENFKLGVAAATGGIFLVYLVSIVMRLFGFQMPFIHDTGPIGIGFSLFVVVLASLNLVLDFDFIEQGVENQAPRYMEWYAGFGLLVTLVWLYIELLRLLAKLRSSD